MDKKELVKDLLSRYESLKKQRQPWEDKWQQIIDYVNPSRVGLDYGTQGERKGKTIYDSTGQDSAVKLAEGLMGYLCSQSTPWFNFTLQDEKLGKDPSVRRWLQTLEKIFMDLFKRSNFYDCMPEVFMDGGTLGTAVLLIEKRDENRNISFKPRHIKEYYLAENEAGIVDTIVLDIEIQNREAVKKYGEKNFKKEFLNEAKEDPYSSKRYLWFVMPREDRNHNLKDKKNMEYASFLIQKDGSDLIHEGGYNSFPFISWRYRKNTDEVYGRSDTWDALPEIFTANRIRKSLLEGTDQALKPMLSVPQSMMGKFKSFPGAHIPQGANGQEVKAINITGNIPLGNVELQDVRSDIREKLHTNFFLMLNSMRDRTKTATEVMAIQGEQAAVLSAVSGRIQSEFFDPVFKRMYDIAASNFWIPDPPQVLMQNPSKVNIVYNGPLAQIQKKHYGMQGVQAGLNQLLPLSQVFPNISQIIDPDTLGRHILQTAGFPEAAMRDQGEIDKMRKAAAQQQIQAQQQAGLAQAAEIYNKTSKNADPGSPGAALAEAVGAGKQ